MKAIFPNAPGFSCSYWVGLRKSLIEDDMQRVGVCLVKREYDLTESGLVPRSAPFGIRTKDLTHPSSAVINRGSARFAHVLQENDLAPYKPLVDVVVEGGYQDNDDCELWVEPTELWFSRSGTTGALGFPDTDDTIEDTEARTNMFGWQPRTVDPRLSEGLVSIAPAQVLDPSLERPLEIPFKCIDFDYAKFRNHYFNGYRRTFARPGFPAANLPAGATITVKRTRAGIARLWQFTVPDEQFNAHFFVHDGISQDKRRNWCRRLIDSIRLDTLLINLGNATVFVIWRGLWPYEAYPEDRYRLLQVDRLGAKPGCDKRNH